MSANDNLDTDQEPANTNDVDTSAKNIDMTSDIHDSPQDEEKMKTETAVIDLPDVSDIPGQENIVVPQFGEMADATASSDDEEGAGLFGDDDADEDTDMVMGNEADVTGTESTLLEAAGQDMPEDDSLLRQSELDTTDDEGETLNEGSLSTDVSGGDLDISGAESDDPMEDIGEEDEENNDYSLGSESNDNVTEGTP